MHPDGYIQLKDRSKDIIISGGENISSIEVEDALYKHPAVQAAAVVAKPDDKWGETPCAFVELKPGQSATTDELIAWCRKQPRRLQVPALRGVRRTAEDLAPARSRSSSCARWRRRCEGLRARSWKARTQSMRLIRVMRAKCLRKNSLARWRSGPPLQPG